MALEGVQEIIVEGVSATLDAVGLAGVSAGAVVTVVMLLIWGYRLQTLAALSRKVIGAAFRHALVSGAVLVIVGGAALYVGIIPGVNVDAAIGAAQDAAGALEDVVAVAGGPV
jgi:hypothetical protein